MLPRRSGLEGTFLTMFVCFFAGLIVVLELELEEEWEGIESGIEAGAGIIGVWGREGR
jgi:hypothetical protein